jgi:hypothetical protein
MLAEPKLTPVICGCADGVVAPLKILTLDGEMDTLLGSELESVTTTPLAGAGVESVTGKAAD